MIFDDASLSDVGEHFNVSRETIEKMQKYSDLLSKWNRSINLVSKTTLQTQAVRHFADSLQLWQYRKDFDNWVDIGSGAGFPGLVLAILSAEENPNGRFHLVESDARKSAFLRNVSRETNTPVTIHTERVEELAGLKADIVSARALAPLKHLFGYTEKMLNPDAISLYLKGQNCEIEITEASQHWSFGAERFSSETDRNATILRVRDIARVE